MMEKEILAVVPNFKLKPCEPEPETTTSYPEMEKAYVTYENVQGQKPN